MMPLTYNDILNPFRWKCLHDPGSWVEKWVTPLSFRHVLSLFNHSRLAHLFFWIEAQRENSKQRWPDYSRTIWGTWKKLPWRISCICSLHPKGTLNLIAIRSYRSSTIVNLIENHRKLMWSWRCMKHFKKMAICQSTYTLQWIAIQ